MRIGSYELLRQLDRGGMAEIHLARAVGIEGFEKLVVVKRVLPGLAGREDYRRMFLDEARLVASLHHPNLVHVYELGIDGGQHFLSMEYVHGADLRRILDAAPRTPIPIEHSVSIAVGICAGLHYAHERRNRDGTSLNLVHRDVSARNVLVTYDGGVKLVDFGIALVERADSARTGAVKGTPQYMSPEQARGEEVDRRSDVFAAGILLWEMTTGRSLFTGADERDILRRVAEQDAPAPSGIVAGYPASLERIVGKTLCRRRDARFQTAEELQLALEEFARDHRLGTSPVGLARFMRERLGDEVAAYLTARDDGTLVSHALDQIDTIRDRSMTAVAAAPPPTSADPAPTRKLPGGPARARTGRRALVAAAMLAFAGGSTWYALRSSGDAERVGEGASAPAPSPPAAVPPLRAADAAPPATPVRASIVPAAEPAPAAPPRRSRRTDARAARPPAKPKRLTERELDALLPPPAADARSR